MPATALLACLELAVDRITAYLRTHLDGPILNGSWEVISNNVYFGAVSAGGTLTYGEVMGTISGFLWKLHEDGYTSLAADILSEGMGEKRVGYSVLQWASVARDES